LLVVQAHVAWTAFAISFAGVLLFFGELRLMDELKDHEKDKIAHPSVRCRAGCSPSRRCGGSCTACSR